MDSIGPSPKEILLASIAEELGEAALETVQPTEIKEPPSAAFEIEEAPICITQEAIPTHLEDAKVMVGLDSECPRWVPGSVIKWAAWKKGFASDDDAQHAVNHLALAADRWNKANIGVTFEWTPTLKEANFFLCHAPSQGRVLASAFFPKAKIINHLFVFPLAFSRGWKDNMWKIFTHELGHVLGLRHEFAIEKEGRGAVQLGPRNELSVMNYRPEPPEMQESDIVSTRLFYGLRHDDKGNPPKVGWVTVTDYTPA